MKNIEATLNKDLHSPEAKVDFLKKPESFPDTLQVEVVETHMSWVFLTGKYVYKMKKPVSYDFLDFHTTQLRFAYCLEEVLINSPLAGDTYIRIVPLNIYNGHLQLDGLGETVDWLVMMKQIPARYMVCNAVKEGNASQQDLIKAAKLLNNFYHTSPPFKMDPGEYQQRMMKEVQVNSKYLLRPDFKIFKNKVIREIEENLTHFIMQFTHIFDERVKQGKVVDCHGDLKPEHIFLTPKPVIIDRLEFNSELRIMDIAEELSYLSVECDLLKASFVGELFLDIYKKQNKDDIPDILIWFYKAKRAFLRAKLVISHLQERRYAKEAVKWQTKCFTYLRLAHDYCQNFPGYPNSFKSFKI